MITLKGKDGFEVTLDPEKITAFGIEAPVPVLWLRIDGQNYTFTDNIQIQYDMLKGLLHKRDTRIPGIGS